MSRTTRRRALGLAALALALAGVAWASVGALRAPAAGLARAREGTAEAGADGIQTVELTAGAGEYLPNVVHARAGAPLRVRVTVRERHSCATKLLVPDLRAELPLPESGTAELLLPPAPAGSYLFTCEMRMVKGVLLLE